MYKVIIVDDEPIIVEGLRNVIPWGEYGCQVVGVARGGLEGERLAEETRPDIIFTDIRMPDRDGLSMIAALKSKYPDLQITVLTAYRDIEYAQTAVRLGVARYLLKPSKIDELTEALAAMVRRLDDGRHVDEGENDEAGSFVVNNVLRYLEDHYNERLTLSAVATRMYISQWHLSKLLKKHTGKNFCDILNQIRIKRAKVYLKDATLKVYDVSDMVGFSDITHFSKTFKRYCGVSPNEFRGKRHTKDAVAKLEEEDDLNIIVKSDSEVVAAEEMASEKKALDI